MTTFRSRDPLERLPRAERRAWRAAERRARLAHEAEQMSALRDLAATGRAVTGVTVAGGDDRDVPLSGAAPAEMIIDGRRLRAARIHRRSLAALREGLAGLAAVPLTAVGRYGPYWVLTFKLAAEPLVVLADHLTLLPDWGGSGGRGVPGGPLVAAGA